jgi:hypothetical protein
MTAYPAEGRGHWLSVMVMAQLIADSIPPGYELVKRVCIELRR